MKTQQIYQSFNNQPASHIGGTGMKWDRSVKSETTEGFANSDLVTI